MRPFVCLTILLALALSLHPTRCLAEQTTLVRKCSPWGNFAPGAWKTVRITFETLDAAGAVVSTSTSETKTTLEKVGEDGVTLRVETVVEVAGKRFESEPQVVKQGYHGELASQSVKTTKLGSEAVSVLGQKIPCEARQLVFEGPNGKTAKICYSDTIWPHILRRETVVVNPETKEPASVTTVEVEALEMPCKVLAEIKGAAHVKAVHKHPKGTTITLASTSPDVPGGVVYHSSKESNHQGQLVRRSILELTDYGLKPDTARERRRLLRGRSSRLQKR